MFLKAAVNVLLSAWVTGTPLFRLLPQLPKLYIQLRKHRSLCRMVNSASARLLHSRNRLNLIVWEMYREGRLIPDPKREEEIRRKLEYRRNEIGEKMRQIREERETRE